MGRAASFPYTRILTALGFVHVPVARVEVGYRGRRVEVDMVVDTGADLTVIPHQVGIQLGMRQVGEGCSSLSGVGGGTPYLLRGAILRFGPFRLSARVAWAQRGDVPMLLGRVDALDRLVATFGGGRSRVALCARR